MPYIQSVSVRPTEITYSVRPPINGTFYLEKSSIPSSKNPAYKSIHSSSIIVK